MAGKSILKLSWLDAVIILGIALLVFSAYKFLSFEGRIIPQKTVNREIEIVMVNARKELADAIKIGDIAHNASGRVIAEVISKKTKPAERYGQNEAGRTVISASPDRLDVYLGLKVSVIKKRQGWYFLQSGTAEFITRQVEVILEQEATFHDETNYIRVGGAFFLRLDKVVVYGEIINAGQE